MNWLFDAVLVPVLAVMFLAAGVAQAARAAASVRSTFELQVPMPPTAVRVAGTSRLVYELHLTNFARDVLTLKRVAIHDAESGATIAELREEALDQRLGRPGWRACRFSPWFCLVG